MRGETGIRICFCDLERFIRGLHVLGFALENVIRLLKIEKSASDIRCNRASHGFEGLYGSVAPRARGDDPPARGKAIEDVPARVQPDDVTVIEFVADSRIALVINFVTGERFQGRLRLAQVQFLLEFFDCDVDLARTNFRPIRVSAGEAFI